MLSIMLLGLILRIASLSSAHPASSNPASKLTNSTWFSGNYGPTYNPSDWPTLLTIKTEPDIWHNCATFADWDSDNTLKVYESSTTHQVYCWVNGTLEDDAGTTLLRTTDDCYINEEFVLDGDQSTDANGMYNGTVIDYTDPAVLPWCGEVRPYGIRWPEERWMKLGVTHYYGLPCWRRPDGRWNQTAGKVVGGMLDVVHEKTVWNSHYWCWVTGSVFNTSSKWYEYGVTIDNERCWLPEEFLKPYKALPGGDEECPWWEWP
ncbi:uncharacterized protein LY89DRAFT_725715 [Mollisia scopiformis]|uniref:Uncharacterized protein n=1 Tax=Mollisia scopiformis TaxID=149040 RepID=A0A132B5H5_MOLSC|nr:uncharacterized protein LY89DRAFT_725715 [Mollisia scopiformis]KUJ07591.1 hypothetical protein LY89DRAFT_725715 [Mollisia scopiformis]